MTNFTAEPLALAEVILIRPRRFGDARGYFLETYRAGAFAALGIDNQFVQENQAFSAERGTIRGLHFQAPPDAQAKLIRVIRGAIFDIALDLRRGSPSYGRWAAATLTAESAEQLYVPRGFAHGYCTLVPDTEIAYKCDAYYAPAREGGVHHADPDLGITWPVPAAEAVMSERDRTLPRLCEIGTPFTA